MGNVEEKFQVFQCDFDAQTIVYVISCVGIVLCIFAAVALILFLSYSIYYVMFKACRSFKRQAGQIIRSDLNI
ncbi:hypothetical protein Ddc_20221 [Ditylenchus destructor]|nr:hypothetical protein Ddc_20221 [Ditylenchus destructor]